MASRDGELCTCILRDMGTVSTSCGYCERGQSKAHHVEIWNMDPKHYQMLLDRGWRRCGMWMYQPVLHASCCRTVAMRVRAEDWKPSKELKKCVRRMESFLSGKRGTETYPPRIPIQAVNHRTEEIQEECEAALEQAWKRCDVHENVDADPQTNWKVREPSKRASATYHMDLFCNAALPMAARLKKRGINIEAQTIAMDVVKNLQREGTPIEKAHAQGGFINIYLKNQTGMRKEEEGRPRKMNRIAQPAGRDAAEEKKATQQKHKLGISIIPASFEEESYELFFLYQTKVHKQAPSTVSRSHYFDFLVRTPFRLSGSKSASKEGGHESLHTEGDAYGTFHHQYRIDGKLVAVGVVDILPECLSSKYLFWHPDYHDLSLGKYSAIREIQWVAKAQTTHPRLQFYYPGYYLPSCPKMAYKAVYQPAELLCPVTYRWIPFRDFDHSLFQTDVPFPHSHFDAQTLSREALADIYKTKLLVQISDGRLVPVLLQDIMVNQSNASMHRELHLKLLMWHSAVGPDVAKQSYYVLNGSFG